MLEKIKVFKVRFVRASIEDYCDFDEDIDIDMDMDMDSPAIEIIRDGKRVLIEYNHSEDLVKTAVSYIRNKLKFTPIGVDSDKNCYYVVAK